jgi:hypothetical protein
MPNCIFFAEDGTKSATSRARERGCKIEVRGPYQWVRRVPRAPISPSRPFYGSSARRPMLPEMTAAVRADRDCRPQVELLAVLRLARKWTLLYQHFVAHAR